MFAVIDPGFAVDLTCLGNIADFVAVYLDHVAWRAVTASGMAAARQSA
jgi:hypothetical protein